MYLVDVPGLLPLHYQGSADDLGGGRHIQEEGLTGLWRGQGRRLGDEYFEVASTLCISSIQRKESDFFNNL
jgi:hypothetical protein